VTQPVRRVLAANRGWFRVQPGQPLTLAVCLRADAEEVAKAGRSTGRRRRRAAPPGLSFSVLNHLTRPPAWHDGALANGDILLSGPQAFDPENAGEARVQCWLHVLDRRGTKPAVPLGTQCSEGPNSVWRSRGRGGSVGLHSAKTLGNGTVLDLPNPKNPMKATLICIALGLTAAWAASDPSAEGPSASFKAPDRVPHPPFPLVLDAWAASW
jgi:hypothetical protein